MKRGSRTALVVSGDDADRAVAHDHRNEQARPYPDPARDLLVDLGVLERRVDPLAPSPFEHPAALRAGPGQEAAGQALGQRADRRLDPEVAPGSGQRDQDELGVDQVAEPSGDQLEERRQLGLARKGVPDLGQRLELREPARRRLVQAGVLDRDGGLRGEQRHDLLVLGGEVVAVGLLGQVEVPVGDAAEQDRDPEEGPHQRVVRGKADRPRIRRQVVEPERVRFTDQDAENPAAAGQVADPLVRLRVDPGGQEALERDAGAVDHAERRIAGGRQLGGGLDDPLEHTVESELGRDRDPRVDEAAPAGFHGPDYEPSSRLRTYGRIPPCRT